MGKYKIERKCIVEGCNGKHLGRGYCRKHLYQINKYGYIKEPVTYDPICIVPGCSTKQKRKGYCVKHYTQIRAYGRVKETIKHNPICIVLGCDAQHKGHGYCNRHLKQIQQYGHIKRTMYDPNIFDLEDDICKIRLFNKNGEKTGTAIIDIEDYVLVKNRKWHLKKGYTSSYVCSGNSSATYLSLSRFIANAEKGKEVDHKDQDFLNNRRNNLRVCTKSQNQCNSKKRTDNKSGAKNVYFCKTSKRWKVTIQKNNVRYLFGPFKSFHEAESAATSARKEHHGKFAYNG